MVQSSDVITTFLESLMEGGTPRPDLLTEDAAFMALNVKVTGRDDVMARMTAETTGRVYRTMTWAAPLPDNEALQVRGELPAGGRLGGLILTVHFDGDLISIIQQQNLPGTPMPASDLKLPDTLKELVGGALANRTPMLVAYGDEDGQPVLSFRGSTQAFSDDQLAIWVRNASGSFIASIQANPKVALMYRDEDKKATYQFQGRAHIATDETSRDAVYQTMAQVERDHDFARTGVAVIIDLDSVQGFAGLGPTGPIDPIRMARGGG